MLTSTPADRRRLLPGGRSLHLLLLAFAVSSVGDWLYNVALLALVYERTGSATWVALTTAARVLPMVVLGPFGGALADRHDRRGLLIGSDLSRAALMVALAAVAATGLPIVLVPVLAAAAVAAGVVTPPSVAGCAARLVSDDELQRATALRSAIGQGAMVAGPALGAVILLVTSPSVAILVNAVTFIGSAIAVLAIGSDHAFAPTRDAAAPSLLADIRAGADALRGQPSAVRLIAADLLCSAVYGLLTVTLVLVSRRVGAGDGGYGVLLGAFGVGGVIGATVAGRVNAPSRWRGLLSIALLLVGLALAALGVIPTLAGAAFLAAVCGGGMVVGEVLSDTALPRLLDDAVLARAWGLVLPVSIAGIVAGSLIAGPLVSLLGLQGALMTSGLFVLLAAWLLLRRPLTVTSEPPSPVSPARLTESESGAGRFAGLRSRRVGLAGLTVLMCLWIVSGASASPGWSPTASMSTARYWDTATLLPDGSVLVTGGDIPAQNRSTEEFQPGTNSWIPEPALSAARINQTATLLANGKVLITGGSDAGAPLASTDLLDWRMRTDTAGPPMATARFDQTATLLSDGDVLVAGGFTGNPPEPTATAELYHPSSDLWSSAGSMGMARAAHTATLLPDGKVLVAGGQDGAGNVTATAELYDPASNTWSPAGSLATAREQQTATLLPDGRVLVAGGYVPGDVTAAAELYDPASNSWSPAASMSTPRAGDTATLLSDGSVLIAGGTASVSSGAGELASAELYDPASDSWSSAGSMTTARTEDTATLLSDGRVLVAGGLNSSAELYTPPTTASSLAGDFGDQTVAQPGPVVYLPVTDTGDEPLFVTSAAVGGDLAGDFSITHDGCTNSRVTPGATCWLGVRFTPSAAGPAGATITLA
ncbi:MAG TPA: MFS transporter, partial [Solirubrobacteraceae bacterium]